MPEAYGALSRKEALSRLLTFEERARLFSGWDFSNLGVRNIDPGPPWDYEQLARSAGKGRKNILDLGTGGGEMLSRIRSALEGRVVATEEWVVNAPVARDRLSPQGVHVVRAKSLHLPFRDSSFDLVIDRHEEFDPREVDRVLSAGGQFLTQQVGSRNWRELRRPFPRFTDFGDHRSSYVDAFRIRGFHVDSKEHEFRVAYPSLGEFVFMLSVAPWEIPGFDVHKDLEALLAFESDCLTREGLVVTESRYLMTAVKSR